MHLGMSGSLAFEEAPGPPGAHDHFDLVTDRGTLRLTDPRRFGAVVWSEALDAGMAGKLLSTLGVEPLDAVFDGPYLHAALQRRRVAIKLALLGGDIVVGAGNIFRGVWPQVLVLVITLAILLAFPGISLWLPSMMD